jgi:hypothetical protein
MHRAITSSGGKKAGNNPISAAIISLFRKENAGMPRILANRDGGTLPLLFALFNDLFSIRFSTLFRVVEMNGDYGLD